MDGRWNDNSSDNRCMIKQNKNRISNYYSVVLQYIRAVASTTSYSKSQAFLKQKLAIIDNIIRMARSNKTIWNPDYYKKKFSSATSDQFWAIYRSSRMQPSFLAAIAMPFMILCMAFIAANLKSRFIASNTKQVSIRERAEHMLTNDLIF